jgi:nucleoside-triphosphatase THEP1
VLIVITGSIGAGKSTVCLGLLSWAARTGHLCGGVLSHKAEGGVIVVENISTRERRNLAGPPGLYDGPRIGDFSFSPQGIEFGLGAIRDGMSLPLTLIDELGPLELAGSGFASAIPLLNSAHKGNQVVVVRESLLDLFLPLFGRRTLVLRTTPRNRDILPWQISRLIAVSPATHLHQAASPI